MFERTECQLLPLTAPLLRQVLAWRNSDRIRPMMYSDRLISWEEHLAWFEVLAGNAQMDFQVFHFRGSPTGIVQFTGIDRTAATAKWGFYIGREGMPPGLGQAMGYLGLEFGFKALDLKEILGEAFSFNSASIRFHEKLGFTESEAARKSILKAGQMQEIVSFHLKRESWISNQVKLSERIFLNEHQRFS